MKKLLLIIMLLLSNEAIAATYFSEVGPSGRVRRTEVIPDAFASNGQNYLNQLIGINSTWIQTFIDNSGPGYSGIGSTYDGINFKSNFSLSIIGDSIILNMSATATNLLPPFPNAQYLGVSGDRLDQIQARLGTISGNATHVILEGGTNDFAQSNDSAVIPEYTAILNALTPTKKVIIFGIPQVDEATIDPARLSQLNNTKINAMNIQIANLCSTYAGKCFMSGVKDINMSGKTSDGIHPVAAEYIEISNILFQAL